MIRRVSFAVLLVAAGFVIGLLVTGRLQLAQDGLAGPAVAAPAGDEAAASAQPRPTFSGLPDFAEVTARAVPAVVNISSQQAVSSPFADDPFWGFFFGGDEDLFGTQRSTSLGSGVIVSPDGYIVTNHHVLFGQRGARGLPEIDVVLPDKREMRARLVGADEATDIALIKLDVRGLPVVPFGDSSKLRVGQWVLAIGSPFQLNSSVTLGIISAVGRTNVGVSDYEDFIQTDAAINPGNSGGAMIDARGELVGINTAILSRSGGYQGIGFAVPSNLARRIVDDLIEHGEVRRGWIGALQVQAVTTSVADYLGIPDTRGALVSRMTRIGPAYEAGIRPGDVIVEFNRTRVDDPAALIRLVADASIGSTATLVVIRDGKRVSLTVRVETQQARSRPTRGRDRF